MLVEKVEKEQSNNSSVEFKLQISKDKIEKNLPQNSFKNIKEALFFVDCESHRPKGRCFCVISHTIFF